MVQYFVDNSTGSDDLETERICFDLLLTYENNESLLDHLVESTLHLKKIHISKEWINGNRIEKLLTVLRDNLRIKTLKGISQLVFVWRPDVYERIYQPERSTTNVVPTDVQSLTTHNYFGLTTLHRAAFYDETKAIDRILFETYRRGWDIVHVLIVTSENKLTPLFMASIRRHEQTCFLLLKYFRKVQ